MIPDVKRHWMTITERQMVLHQSLQGIKKYTQPNILWF
jgi:hypothetical protein